jgi:hypothetical protein
MKAVGFTLNQGENDPKYNNDRPTITRSPSHEVDTSRREARDVNVTDREKTESIDQQGHAVGCIQYPSVP